MFNLIQKNVRTPHPLSEKNLFTLLCLKDKNANIHLETLDCVYAIIVNSLRYNEYHRALKFLRFYDRICKREFSEDKVESYRSKLCKKLSLPA